MLDEFGRSLHVAPCAWGFSFLISSGPLTRATSHDLQPIAAHTCSHEIYADANAEIYYLTAEQGTRSARASFASSSRRMICTTSSVHINSAWKDLPFFSRIGCRRYGALRITVIGVETRRVYWKSDRANRCTLTYSKLHLKIRRTGPANRLLGEPPRWDCLFFLFHLRSELMILHAYILNFLTSSGWAGSFPSTSCKRYRAHACMRCA